MAERLPYGFEIEGLCHDYLIMKSRVDSGGDVTGQKHERYASDPKGIGSGIRQFLAEIHIQDRGVRRRGLNEAKRDGDRVRGAHYFVPKLLQNILKQHSDQGLIIEQKNARHKACYRPGKAWLFLTAVIRGRDRGTPRQTVERLGSPSQMPLDRRFFIVACSPGRVFPQRVT